MKVENIIEDVAIATGTAISLVDIQQVLSIILLVFNVLWITVKMVVKVVDHYKNKDLKAIADDVKDARDEIEQLTGKTNDSTVDDDARR